MQIEAREIPWFLPVRVAKHGNKLFREAVEYKSVEIFRTRLDTVLDDLLKQGVEVGDLERSIPLL